MLRSKGKTVRINVRLNITFMCKSGQVGQKPTSDFKVGRKKPSKRRVCRVLIPLIPLLLLLLNYYIYIYIYRVPDRTGQTEPPRAKAGLEVGKWDILGKKALQAADLLGLSMSHFKKHHVSSRFTTHFIKNSI